MSPDDIATAVIDLFLKGTGDDKTRRKFKTVRPTGAEWTIVAGVVAIHGDDTRVISLGSGLKVMPDAKIRERSHGRMVHDCHAEILAMRAFNAWIIEECIRKDPSSFLEFGEKKIRLKDGWSFALYVSELPCGDCSMSSVVADLQARGEDATPWKDKEDNGSTIRGRGQFDRLGIVRTKPGRVDSPVSYSKSCSDKLSVRQFDGGLLNCVTASLVDPHGFHIKYLISPQNEVLLNEKDIQRCFYSRFKQKPNWFKPVQMLPTSAVFPHSRRGEVKRQSSPLCFAWNAYACDVIVQGVRNGRMKKGSHPILPGAEPFVSRLAMAEAIKGFRQVQGSYTELFKECERSTLKGKLEKMLDSWVSTSDDFIIT